MDRMNADERDRMIERNLQVFEKALPELLKSDYGRFALLSDEKIVGLFDTVRDANLAGAKLFSNGNYSIQEVTDQVVDLGIFSYVGSLSTAR